MTNRNSSDNECCTCMPYKDAIIISAQIISIVAVFISWTTFFTMICGIVAFVCFQMIWCCRMNRCGLITTGVFSVIAGTLSVIAAVLVLAAGSSTICNSQNYDDDFYTEPYYEEDACKVGINVYVGIAFVAGALWLAAGTLVFIFSCGDRHRNAQGSRQAAQNEVEAVVVGRATAAQKVEPNATNDIEATGSPEPVPATIVAVEDTVTTNKY